jgi:hypothetical protein
MNQFSILASSLRRLAAQFLPAAAVSLILAAAAAAQPLAQAGGLGSSALPTICVARVCPDQKTASTSNPSGRMWPRTQAEWNRSPAITIAISRLSTRPRIRRSSTTLTDSRSRQ